MPASTTTQRLETLAGSAGPGLAKSHLNGVLVRRRSCPPSALSAHQSCFVSAHAHDRNAFSRPTCRLFYASNALHACPPTARTVSACYLVQSIEGLSCSWYGALDSG